MVIQECGGLMEGAQHKNKLSVAGLKLPKNVWINLENYQNELK